MERRGFLARLLGGVGAAFGAREVSREVPPFWSTFPRSPYSWYDAKTGLETPLTWYQPEQIRVMYPSCNTVIRDLRDPDDLSDPSS